MFDAFGVEYDHAALSHIKSDDGAWVVDDAMPKGSIGIIDVLEDEDGIGGEGAEGFLVVLDCRSGLFVDDDDGLVAVVVTDAKELLLEMGGEVSLFVGIVGKGLEEHIADEFVCPRGLNAKPAPMDGAGWCGKKQM